MKKAAVIGLGDISKIHIPIIESSPDMVLCAVCDSNPEAKKAAPSGTAFYTDYHEMVEKERIRELLEKQLELLSEQSRGDPAMLPQLTDSMVQVVSLLRSL